MSIMYYEGWINILTIIFFCSCACVFIYAVRRYCSLFPAVCSQCNIRRRARAELLRHIFPERRRKPLHLEQYDVSTLPCCISMDDQTRHLAPVSVMLFGSCHLILERVRQPLWEQVQEKYWPNKVTSGASKKGLPSIPMVNLEPQKPYHLLF